MTVSMRVAALVVLVLLEASPGLSRLGSILIEQTQAPTCVPRLPTTEVLSRVLACLSLCTINA